MACEPSTSWVSALPMSCRNAARLHWATSSCSSAAISPAMWALSTRCLSTFCPYEVRYRRVPSTGTRAGCRSEMPTSAMASSAARRHSAWIWPLLRSCTSSIRAGWIRPSLTSSIKVIRAVSRRTGSKQDSSTDSGVSSIITLTPVTCSKARMLRPSRPMIRPFMSSPGRWTAETTDSDVCSDATRWMAPATIIWAREVASRAAARSMSRATSTACRLASCSTAATSSALACSAVSPAIRSRVDCCSASISATALR